MRHLISDDDVLAFDTSPISLAIDRSNVAKVIENQKIFLIVFKKLL